MSLFKVNKTTVGEANTAKVMTDKSPEVFLSGPANVVLKNIVLHLVQNRNLHFVSEGVFSMHELLEECLKVTGPADVYISTWAITEIPGRTVVQLKARKIIRKLFILFDYKIKERSPKVLQMLEENATKFSLTRCHAKQTVIIGKKYSISICGSANYTRNPRIECGVVSCSAEAGEFHKQWIMQHINQQKL